MSARATSSPLHVRILGKVWRLVFVPGRRVRQPGSNASLFEWGSCDAPDTPGKQIRIAKGLPLQDELDTVIHECLHAADWSKSEEWVFDTARDLARVLWRLGWRKIPAAEPRRGRATRPRPPTRKRRSA